MESNIAKIRKELTDTVDKLKEQSDRVSHMSHVPSLEIHVMMARVTHLYEKAVLYKNALEINEAKKLADADKVKEDIPKQEKQPEVEAETKSIENEHKPKTAPPVNEPVDFVEKMRLKPIEDLKKALSLHEQYLYANELFDGDTSALMDALSEINQMENATHALGHAKASWANQYNWDKDNKYVVSFFHLIERKFMS